MPSFVTTTAAFDNIEAMKNDLLRFPRSFDRAHSVGFLLCDIRIDYAALADALSRDADFPILGVTTIAFPLSETEISASLTLLTKDELAVSCVVSAPINGKGDAAKMRSLYDQCVSGLDGKPDLFVLLHPDLPGLMVNSLVEALLPLAGDVPVVGGMGSFDMIDTEITIFLNGEAYTDRMVLLALGGVDPVFSVETQLTVITDYAPTVTSAEANIVKTVDDMPFVKYFETLGFPVDDEEAMDALFLSGPIHVTVNSATMVSDGVPMLRGIESVNLSDGSACFTGAVPVGAKISMGTLLIEDIADTARRAADQLFERAGSFAEKDLLIFISCSSRYLAMTDEENIERRIIRYAAVGSLVPFAFYSFGEIGPTIDDAGRLHNRTHAGSIVLCAI